MAIFGLLATTWVDQMSSRDFGCSDNVRCAGELSVLGLLPVHAGPDQKPATDAGEQPHRLVPTQSVALRHQLASSPLRILSVAPKTSPPA